MADLIHEHSIHIRTAQGVAFVARTYAEQDASGIWVGCIEFTPASGSGPVLRAEHETTQPNREAVAYWASGLEPIYFEGAFQRAQVVA